jgi:hypothetical protein
MQKQTRSVKQPTSSILFQNQAEFQAVVYAHAMSMVTTGLREDDALERAARLLVQANDEEFMSLLLKRVATDLAIKNPIVEEPPADAGYSNMPTGQRRYSDL